MLSKHICFIAWSLKTLWDFCRHIFTYVFQRLAISQDLLHDFDCIIHLEGHFYLELWKNYLIKKNDVDCYGFRLLFKLCGIGIKLFSGLDTTKFNGI